MADPAIRRFALDLRWIVVAMVLIHWAIVLTNDIGITARYLGLEQALLGQGPRLVELLVGGFLLVGLFTRFSRAAGVVLSLATAAALAGTIAYAGFPGRLWAWVQVGLVTAIVLGCAALALRPHDRARP